MTSMSANAPGDTTPASSRRWIALAIIAIGQLMIVVDGSIVNIALPSAQHALHISLANRQWVVTAYTLTFGGLLLLGGRIADYMGRKRTFIVGLIGFALASALGGIAQDQAMLFGARGLQGAFAALMAPASLSLVAVTFTNPKDRAKAFGVFGAIAGSGAAIGVIAGGILVQYSSWRWCLLVNVPIGVVTAVLAVWLLDESRAVGRAHYDLPGAATVTVGLTTLVYGLTEAAGTGGWGSASALVPLITAGVLLIAFVLIELKVDHPLLPLRVVLDRNRGGAFLTSMSVGAGLFGMFLFLSYYLQGTLHFSPLKTGFAFLPFSAGIIVSAGIASFLMPRTRPRVLMGVGLVVTIAGLLSLTQLGVDSSYATHILPGIIVMSLGLGLIFVPVTSVSLLGVEAHDAGVASAMVNATQQVGGSIGTALLNTVAVSAVTGYIATHGGRFASTSTIIQANVHSYTIAFWVAGGLMFLGLVAVLSLITTRVATKPTVDVTPTESVAPEIPVTALA